MAEHHCAGVAIALGQRRDDEFGNRAARVVAAFGFVPPDNDHAVVLICGRSHDLRNNDGEEVVTLRNASLVAGVMRALVSEPAAQRAVRVVKLIRRDPIVSPDSVVVQVVKQLGERIDILELRVDKERHRVVLHSVIELAGAIVGIDERGARPRCTVDRTGGKLNVLLIILPRNARGIQLPG